MPSTFKPLSREHLNELQRELVAAVRDKYEDANKLDIVTTVLIPHFRAELEKAIGAVPHAQDRSLTPDEIDALCSAVDSILKTQDVLLNAKPERLFDPVIAAMQNVRQRVRVKLTEEYYRNVRAALHEHGVIDMRTLTRKGVVWFSKISLDNLGAGNFIACQLLGRKIKIGGLKTDDLLEIGNILGFENNMHLKMDRAYFDNRDNVHYDLQALAAAVETTIEELNTSCLNVKFICKNGETITGTTYLYRAAIALGLAKHTRKAQTMTAAVLIILKKLIGIKIEEYKKMDRAYFEDKGNVFHDLSAWVTAKQTTIVRLRNDGRDTREITCKNGERIRLSTYLNRAAVALGFAKKKRQANAKRAVVLVALKKTIGAEVEEYRVMDRVYFEDINTVRHDLNSFAVAAGTTIDDLSVSESSTKSTCENGESITLSTYLSRAAVVLNIAASIREGKNVTATALMTLKKLIGIEITAYNKMDKAYFEDSDSVHYDLQSFATAAKTTIDELNTGNLNVKFICKNGETITGKAYLYRAAITLGLAKNQQQAQGMTAKTLAVLKKTIGIEV